MLRIQVYLINCWLQDQLKTQEACKYLAADLSQALICRTAGVDWLHCRRQAGLTCLSLLGRVNKPAHVPLIVMQKHKIRFSHPSTFQASAPRQKASHVAKKEGKKWEKLLVGEMQSHMAKGIGTKESELPYQVYCADTGSHFLSWDSKWISVPESNMWDRLGGMGWNWWIRKVILSLGSRFPCLVPW